MDQPTKSSQFRYIYSNAIGMGFNGQECFLTFGVKADPTTPDTDVFQEVGVVLTANSAKYLLLMLQEIIGSTEKLQGHEFLVDRVKVQQIRDIVAKAEETHRAADTGAASETPSASPPPS